MRRREVIGSLYDGVLGSGIKSLSRVREATTCIQSSQFSALIENHRESSQYVPVAIETGLLGRDVFSKTFDIPTATGHSSQTYHSEAIYESDVLDNLRWYLDSPNKQR